MDYPMIVIAGATATGKTKAAVNVAGRINGEIISADSMQVYKYMNIGTAKPSLEERNGIKHYLIDELYPHEEFNVAVFKVMAERYAKTISESGKIPIIAGGTGFYINALIKNTDFVEAEANENIRKRLLRIADEEGGAKLYEMLKQIDPDAADTIHQNNIKRVIRAIEYFEVTGERISLHNKKEKSRDVSDKICYYVLNMERGKLYSRIDERVDLMMEAGLLNEVKSLLEMGYDKNLVSMQGIGYKELVKHINGEYSIDEAIYLIKKGSRNYAKRQITWFKNQTNGIIIDAEWAAREPEAFCDLISKKISLLQS